MMVTSFCSGQRQALTRATTRSLWKSAPSRIPPPVTLSCARSYAPVTNPVMSTTTTSPIEVLLYGSGAIGSFYAFILQRSARVRLSIAARSNYNAIKTNGLFIKSENHGEHHFRPAAVYRDMKESNGKAFDFVVCCNKAVDLSATARDLMETGAVKEGKSTIVLMQNGVVNEEPFAKVFPRVTILSGVVWIGATQNPLGVIRQHLNESTTIGIFSNTNIPSQEQQDSLDLFTSLMLEGGTPYVVDPSIQTARWKKCIWNVAWNSLTTLTGCDCHEWLKSSTYAMESTGRLMNEAIDVAKAIKVPDIEYGLADELIERMLALKGPVFTSMYHDAKAGREMELEVILGNIVRKGKENSIPTPTLEMVYAMLVALQGRINREKREHSNG